MCTKKCNFHTHSTFCDGKNTAEEMVISAINAGITVLGFSGHWMHPLNPEFYKPFDDIWHIPSDKIQDYVNEVLRLKDKYAEKIQIMLGFEADYFSSPEYGTAIPDFDAYSQFSPDFLIGSVHFANTPSGFYTVDHKTEIVKENLIKLYSKPNGEIDGRAAVCDYFQAQREMLQKGNFDIWGHPDLIRKRNGVLKFFDEKESWYKEELRLTALTAAKTNVIAEINTGAIARGAMDDTYPSAEFLEIIYDLGIPVCINSDAHTTDGIDCAFDRAIQLAKKTGYTELVYPDNIIVEL